MNDYWIAIREQVNAILPALATSFNPPASDDQIDFLEKVLNVSLPQSFITYLKTFNGQHQIEPPFEPLILGYNYLFSVNEILNNWSCYVDLFDDDPKIDFLVENKVQPVYWDRGWIPFAGFNGGSSLLCIDLNPGRNGYRGQIIQYFHACDLEADDIVKAASFDDFSEILLARLTTHQYEIDDNIICFTDEWFV
ncbi:SMI1/KNR4 family protein [Spirosoma pollinicola]|uniref:SMI1/KNR4 family protein n=1 Tax=Spirosoma pollinicola TaxID=2057025 RepID=A0A2K8Z2H7_9BACT|nr:SMI1/KNR4 family protein [Spirosoma pollinicola]AUD04090.1 SMI1/KNR4 family protein [Spirosoma pollinicola]